MVIVVLDPVDLCLDCCSCRSIQCCLQLHEMEQGLVVLAIEAEVIVGCLMYCGDGSDSKRFLPPKMVAYESVFGTVATGNFL